MRHLSKSNMFKIYTFKKINHFLYKRRYWGFCEALPSFPNGSHERLENCCLTTYSQEACGPCTIEMNKISP